MGKPVSMKTLQAWVEERLSLVGQGWSSRASREKSVTTRSGCHQSNQPLFVCFSFGLFGKATTKEGYQQNKTDRTHACEIR